MKKIYIMIFVALLLVGCNSTQPNNNSNDNESTSWQVIEYDDQKRIWLIPQYNPISKDEYYMQEKVYDLSLPNIRIKAKDDKLYATYNADVTKGLYVETQNVTYPSYNEETGIYTPGSKEIIDKQYYVETKDGDKYKSIDVSDGYWFYYQKRVFGGDQLVRINYKGEQQIVLDDFDINDCYSIAYPDQDVLYILKFNSFKKDYSVKLYWIYTNEMIVEIFDSGILSTEIILPEFIEMNSSYHIMYKGENPLFTEKQEELMNDESLLNEVLNKYGVSLKEDNSAYFQYNSYVYNALIYKEYGINRIAVFDYDIINKQLTYSPVESDPQFPSEERPYWK